MPVLAQAESGRSEDEVRTTDREQARITLKHGPIPDLKMSGMTMVFRVKDPKLLDAVNEGQEVRFAVVREAGAFRLQIGRAEIAGAHKLGRRFRLPGR